MFKRRFFWCSKQGFMYPKIASSSVFCWVCTSISDTAMCSYHVLWHGGLCNLIWLELNVQTTISYLPYIFKINSVRGSPLGISTEHNQTQNFNTKDIYSLERQVCVCMPLDAANQPARQWYIFWRAWEEFQQNEKAVECSQNQTQPAAEFETMLYWSVFRGQKGSPQLDSSYEGIACSQECLNSAWICSGKPLLLSLEGQME